MHRLLVKLEYFFVSTDQETGFKLFPVAIIVSPNFQNDIRRKWLNRLYLSIIGDSVRLLFQSTKLLLDWLSPEFGFCRCSTKCLIHGWLIWCYGGNWYQFCSVFLWRSYIVLRPLWGSSKFSNSMARYTLIWSWVGPTCIWPICIRVSIDIWLRCVSRLIIIGIIDVMILLKYVSITITWFTIFRLHLVWSMEFRFQVLVVILSHSHFIPLCLNLSPSYRELETILRQRKPVLNQIPLGHWVAQWYRRCIHRNQRKLQVVVLSGILVWELHHKWTQGGPNTWVCLSAGLLPISFYERVSSWKENKEVDFWHRQHARYQIPSSLHQDLPPPTLLELGP